MQLIIQALYVFTYWWKFLGSAADAAVVASGWGTALVFTIFWGIVFQWYTVKRPADAELGRSLDLICREMTQNIKFSINNKLCVFVSTRFYDQVGSKVLLSIDKDGGDALDVLYRTLQLIKDDYRYLQQEHVTSKFEESLTTFCEKTNGLNSKQCDQLLAAWQLTKASVRNAKVAGSIQP